jgi:hypothetical protein
MIKIKIEKTGRNIRIRTWIIKDDYVFPVVDSEYKDVDFEFIDYDR